MLNCVHTLGKYFWNRISEERLTTKNIDTDKKILKLLDPDISKPLNVTIVMKGKLANLLLIDSTGMA